MLLSVWLLALSVPLIGSQILSWEQTEITHAIEPGATRAKGSFFVLNNGESLIQIDRLEVNSFAAKAVIRNKIIYPQKRSQIDVFFDPEKKEGVHHVQIGVYITEQIEPIATLHFIVEIPDYIQCQPKMHTWDLDNRGRTFSSQILIDPRFIDQIDSIEYDRTHYEALLIPSKSDPTSSEVHIKPINSMAPFNSHLEIQARTYKGTHISKRLYLFNRQQLEDSL